MNHKKIVDLPKDLYLTYALQGENFIVYKDSLLFINDKDTLLEIDLIKNNKKIITTRTQGPEGHFFAALYLLKHEKLHFIDYKKTRLISYNINTDSLIIENTFNLADFKDAFVNAVNHNFYYSKSLTDSISIIDSFGKVKRFKNLFSKEDGTSEYDRIFIDQDKEKIIMLSAQSGKFIITDTLFSKILYKSQLNFIFEHIKKDLLENQHIYDFFSIKLNGYELFIGNEFIIRKVIFNNEYSEFTMQKYSTEFIETDNYDSYPAIHAHFITDGKILKVLNIGNNSLEYLQF